MGGVGRDIKVEVNTDFISFPVMGMRGILENQNDLKMRLLHNKWE